MNDGGPHRLAAVVFDVDGTLVDSERDGHRVAFNLAMEEAGLDDRWDPDLYGRLLQVAGGRRRLTHYLRGRGHGDEEAADLAASLHARKTVIMGDLVERGLVQPRPGALALLTYLADHGVDLHVATTGTRAWVAPLLAGAFAGVSFTSVVTGTEVTTLKPHPAVYREVLRRSGHSPGACVAVEDSAIGVAAAVGAGLQCVAVTNDYTRGQDLSAATCVGTGLDDPTVEAWFDQRLRVRGSGVRQGVSEHRSRPERRSR